MAQITKTVDKTSVNGSEIFIYTINAAFSGLTQPAEDGKIIDVFSSKIKYILPPVGGQIKSISQIPVPGGTRVEFNLGAVNAGTSLSFTIACSFGPGRVNNDSFTNQADLMADGAVVAQGTAPTVHLTLDENFLLSKFASPSNVVNAGDEITFVLSLTNSNDAGAEITNIVVTDTLPPQLIPITSFIPVGNDVPTDGYSDPSANGLTGSWNGNTLTFNLPKYSGAKYNITFRARVADNVVPGQTFINTGKWTVNGTSRNDAVLTLIVFDPSSAGFNITKSGPRTTTVGAPMSYNVTNSNTGEVPFNLYVLEDTLPHEVDISSFRLNAGSGLINYSIFIALASAPNTYIPIAQSIPSGSYPLTQLTPYIPAGDRVAKIRIEAQSLNIQNSLHTLQLFGVTNSTAVPNSIFINTATATSGNVTKTAQVSTDVTGRSDLLVNKNFVPSLSAYSPLDEFEVYLRGSALNTITIHPILIDLMPNALRYVENSEYFLYYDLETDTTYDSRNPNFPIALPTREIIPNFAGTGQTLLRWSFLDFILPYGSYIQVIFKVFVIIDPPNSFINKGYEGNPGNNLLFVYTSVSDPLDLDGDGLTTTDLLSASEVNGLVLTTSEFLLRKLVKGQLDLDYSTFGLTIPGGDVNYQLQVTNNQPLDLRDIEIVDILPYVGDTGVILTNQQRGSQFNIYATSAVTAEIVNLIGQPVDPNPAIVIEYSTSNDPKRFDELGNPIGTGDWSLTPPQDITTLRSVKITTGPNVILHSYDRLVVNLGAKTPVGAPLNNIAYNSYAVRANKIIAGELEPMLPTEPNKVGVTIRGAALGSIGDLVWEDLNGNGLYDPGEPGVNGVTVELYSETGTLLKSTVTANNAANQPGYYLFTNLPAGIYQVKFIPYGNLSLTKQMAAEPNGSKPNPETGLTAFITLSNAQQILDIDAGILACPPPVIYASNQCVHVYGYFNPMEGVSAYDCKDTNITDHIIITANNVNTEIPGEYHVTYQVTDSRGQTVSKTITVVVCKTNPRQQSINDLFESVALEQTALSHILNAEGEKIQKASALSLSEDELLRINRSVKDMVNAVATLETVLHDKLDLFSCAGCSDDCCSRTVTDE